MSMFMKVEGVDGDAQDADHDKWIDIQSWSWGAHHAGNMQRGGGVSGGTAQIQELTVNCESSAATATLMKKCLAGAVLAKIEIDTVLHFGGAKATWCLVTLTNCTISDLSQSHSSEGGGEKSSFDSITIGFEEAKQEINNMDDEGQNTGSVDFEFNVAKGQVKE